MERKIKETHQKLATILKLYSSNRKAAILKKVRVDIQNMAHIDPRKQMKLFEDFESLLSKWGDSMGRCVSDKEFKKKLDVFNNEYKSLIQRKKLFEDIGVKETSTRQNSEKIKSQNLIPISNLIEQGEGPTIEFKETLEYDVETNKNNKDVLLSSLKTIAGFLNSDGGTMLIGVNDSGKIMGIERDLGTMKHSSNDKFQVKIRNCLKDRFSPQPIRKVNITFEKFVEGVICRVDVRSSKDVVNLDDDVYVRDGNTTQKLKGRALTDWFQQRNN